MYRLARLNSNGIVLEIIELKTAPRLSLHADVLKTCVDATPEAKVGDHYENQTFEEVKPENEPKSETQIENERIAEVIKNLKALNLEKISDPIVKDVITELYKFFGWWEGK